VAFILYIILLMFNIYIYIYITQEVSSLQDKREAYANESLHQENRALKQDENKSLLERVGNLSFIVGLSYLNT
jgi:hypothetical protein